MEISNYSQIYGNILFGSRKKIDVSKNTEDRDLSLKIYFPGSYLTAENNNTLHDIRRKEEEEKLETKERGMLSS